MYESDHPAKLRIAASILVDGALLAGALMLSVGSAAAQQQEQTAAWSEPSGNPVAGERASCSGEADFAKHISIDLDDFDIDTEGELHYGVAGAHLGADGIDIDVSGGAVRTAEDYSNGVRATHQGTGGSTETTGSPQPSMAGATARATATTSISGRMAPRSSRRISVPTAFSAASFPAPTPATSASTSARARSTRIPYPNFFSA